MNKVLINNGSKSTSQPSKILLINKPSGWTSFDVVAKIRTIYSKREGRKIKVGHAGTLDPFATGLLIILIGDATKKQDSYMKLDKEYKATLMLGHTSTTGDPEGEITMASNTEAQRPELEKIQNIIKNQYTGKISQTPPQYSAIKVDGKPAYKYAREGKPITIQPRFVNIYDIKVYSYHYPLLKITVKCSSGTYIRTLAEDIGASLHTGAFLTELERVKIGRYAVKDAITLDDLIYKEKR